MTNREIVKQILILPIKIQFGVFGQFFRSSLYISFLNLDLDYEDTDTINIDLSLKKMDKVFERKSLKKMVL